jgi:hypothetical protein
VLRPVNAAFQASSCGEARRDSTLRGQCG